MIQDDILYEVVCGVCDVETQVLVYEIDEKPVFCPMCGSDAIDLEE